MGIHINDSFIEPAEYIRWLGVYLDKSLSFKNHVEIWSGKALKVAQLLRRINSVKQWAAPGLLVTAVKACVTPIATYGADVWWPDLTRAQRRGLVTLQTTHLCKLIDRASILALRAALPVWKTIPIAALHREGGIPPARILLECNRLRLSARLQSLDDRHPLLIRARMCPNEGTIKYKRRKKLSSRPDTQMSRVQRAYCQLPQAEDAEPLPGPAYWRNPGSKLEGVEDYQKWIRTVPSSEICAYSDGPSKGHGRSAWGYVLQRAGITFKKERGSLHGCDTFDAEIVGAIGALRAAIIARQGAEKITVLLDNQAAIRAL